MLLEHIESANASSKLILLVLALSYMGVIETCAFFICF